MRTTDEDWIRMSPDPDFRPRFIDPESLAWSKQNISIALRDVDGDRYPDRIEGKEGDSN